MPERRGVAKVIILSIVTLGIYWLYWYYVINKEIMQVARGAVQCSPGIALLSQFVPIAGIVSWYNTAKRLQTAKRAANDPDSSDPAVWLIIAILAPFGIYTALMQGSLNTLIDHISRGAAAPAPAST